jgi:3-hydroxyacyl-[acyl-carrier-protein] dehydratase
MNKLYTIGHFKVDENGRVDAGIHLCREHPVFEGHFPGNPILPGVCTVQIIKELLEKALNKPFILMKAGNIKYLGFINPDLHPEIKAELGVKQGNEGIVWVSASVSFDGKVLCSFKGEFQESSFRMMP